MEKYKGKLKEPKEPKESKEPKAPKESKAPKKIKESKEPTITISDLDSKLDFYNQVRGDMKEMGSRKKNIKEEILDIMNKNGIKEYKGIKVKETF